MPMVPPAWRKVLPFFFSSFRKNFTRNLPCTLQVTARLCFLPIRPYPLPSLKFQAASPSHPWAHHTSSGLSVAEFSHFSFYLFQTFFLPFVEDELFHACLIPAVLIMRLFATRSRATLSPDLLISAAPSPFAPDSLLRTTERCSFALDDLPASSAFPSLQLRSVSSSGSIAVGVKVRRLFRSDAALPRCHLRHINVYFPLSLVVYEGVSSLRLLFLNS